MSDNMSQHCPNCEAQAAEIEYWKAEARSVRKELKSEQKSADNAMDNYDAGVRRIEAQAAEIDRLREALRKISPMVDWMPHPDCVTTARIIDAALAGKAEQ
jgi:uncharacterized Zn finger protein (UPF0148 family)